MGGLRAARSWTLQLLCTLACAVSGCGDRAVEGTAGTEGSLTPGWTPGTSWAITGAGDIAINADPPPGGIRNDEATARLVEANLNNPKYAGAITPITLGDNAYDSGTIEQYNAYYA